MQTKVMMLSRILLMLFVCALCAGVSAQESGLYTGWVQVSGQDNTERRQAMPRALQQVLGKLSGLRDFEAYPGLKSSLSQASSIALSYHYESRRRMLTDGTEVEELWLVADFAESRVDELARSLQLPTWQPERQAMDIWVVVDDGSGRYILPAELEATWQDMSWAARQRGQLLSWPEADEEGMFPVDPQLLWGGYTEELMSRPDRAVVIMAARLEGDQWAIRSYLEYRQQTWVWRQQETGLEAALLESTQLAIDQLAQASSIAAIDQGSQTWELTIAGLRSPQDYQDCLSALQEISVVDSVRVTTAAAGEVTFAVALNALPRYLEEALSNDRRFEAQDEPGQYRLVR